MFLYDYLRRRRRYEFSTQDHYIRPGTLCRDNTDRSEYVEVNGVLYYRGTDPKKERVIVTGRWPGLTWSDEDDAQPNS